MGKMFIYIFNQIQTQPMSSSADLMPFLVVPQVSWMKDQGYGGWMIWALDLDDFSGSFCNQGPYPLLNTLKNALDGSNPPPTHPPTERPPPSTATPSKPTAAPSTTTSRPGPTTTVPDWVDLGKLFTIKVIENRTES